MSLLKERASDGVINTINCRDCFCIGDRGADYIGRIMGDKMMIVDARLKSCATAKYKGCEIEIVTDLEGNTYFRQNHIANVLGISRVGLLDFVRSKLGKRYSVVFTVKCSDDSWNPTAFLSKEVLIDVMRKRKGDKARLLLAWIERNYGE